VVRVAAGSDWWRIADSPPPSMRVYTSYHFLRLKDERSHLLRHDNPLNNHSTAGQHASAVGRNEACLGLSIEVVSTSLSCRECQMRLCKVRDGLVGSERGHCGAPVKGRGFAWPVERYD
jgi:hypothetical protein